MTLVEFIEARLDDSDPGYPMSVLVDRLLKLHNTYDVIFGLPEEYRVDCGWRGCVGCGLSGWGAGYRINDINDCETLYAVAEVLWHWHSEFVEFKK